MDNKNKAINKHDFKMPENNKTAEEIIAELDLDEQNFPHLSTWKDKQHLLRTLEGIAKASRCSLSTAAVNLEMDLGMM